MLFLSKADEVLQPVKSKYGQWVNAQKDVIGLFEDSD